MVNDIISVNGISKSFGPISALCDVSLSVQQGLVTAIVGDNGSGKSTLIKLLSGNLAPDAGTITVEGREHTHLTIAQALQMGIRTVYQDLSLDDWKNSYENIFLGHERMHGPFLDRCRMEREAAEFLLEIDRDHLLSLVLGGSLIECKAVFGQLCRRAGNGIGFDRDVAVLAEIGALHDLHTAAGKVGAVALLHAEAEGRVERAAHRKGLLRVAGVHADVRDLKAERGLARLLAEARDLVEVVRGDVRLGAQPAAADGMDERR